MSGRSGARGAGVGFILGAVGLGIGLLASGGTAAGQTDVSGEIDWLTWTGSGPYTDFPAQIADKFMQLHPNVTVKVDQAPFGGPYLEKLLALKATGRVPDIIANESGSMQTLAQKGITLDLGPLFAASPDFPADDFYPQLRAAGSTVALGGLPAGQLHLLGMSADEWMILFNLDMLAEAGLPVPGDDWTYADLADYAHKLTQKDSSGRTTRWGLAVLPNNADHLANVMAASGEPLLDEATQTLPAGDAFRKALDVYWAGVKDGSILSTEDANAFGGDWQAAFVAGKAAMLQGAIWSTPSIKAATFPWDVAAMPAGPGGRFSAGGTAGWSITKDSDNQAAAWELIKFIYSPDAFSIWTNEKSVVPPLQSLKDVDWAPDVPHAARYLDSIKFLYIQPRGPVYDSSGIWYSGLSDAYNEYVVQGLTLDQAIGDLKTAIDAGLQSDPAANVPVPRDTGS